MFQSSHSVTNDLSMAETSFLLFLFFFGSYFGAVGVSRVFFCPSKTKDDSTCFFFFDVSKSGQKNSWLDFGCMEYSIHHGSPD